MAGKAEALLNRIRLGEDSSLELKTVDFKQGSGVASPRRNDLADELAAMANGRGGLFIFGVDDKTKEILGIPLERLDELETYVREILNDSIDPPLGAHILKRELPDALGDIRPVLTVEVPKSLYVHGSPGGYFQRFGSSKRRLKSEILARLFQQRSQARLIRFEEQTVPGTNFGELSEDRWPQFIDPQSEDPSTALHKLNLLTRDDDGDERATVAGVLFCSEHPEHWLPGAFIEAVRYRGKRQDSNYQMDAAQITGPLDEQIRLALNFARRNMRVAATKRLGRIEVPQFSERAIFEAVVNAVAHRDYSVHGSKIRFFMFDNRLELYSPGALPNSVTLDSIDQRQSTRNELLTYLLSRIPTGDEAPQWGREHFMDRRGDGVPIILEESEKLSGRRPVYRLLDDAELLLTIFSARLPNQDDDFPTDDPEEDSP